MRLFLAIDLPEESKKVLALQLDSLRKEYPAFNWVQPQNYHLTVHFFGETQRLSEISKQAKDIIFEQKPFYLYSTSLDMFMSHYITVYVNFRRERLLEELIDKTRVTFSEEFQEVKKFIPHITVSRCKVPSKQQYFHLQKKISRTDIDLEFPVNEISLFESTVASRVPVYRKVETFPLSSELKK